MRPAGIWSAASWGGWGFDRIYRMDRIEGGGIFTTEGTERETEEIWSEEMPGDIYSDLSGVFPLSEGCQASRTAAPHAGNRGSCPKHKRCAGAE